MAILLYALLADAAVETFLSGSPLRWIVGGTVAAYLILTFLLWKRLRWGIKAALSLLVLLGLLAVTAWLPEGLTRGVTLTRLSTAVVLAAISALAILVSVIVLVRLKFVPLPAKILTGLLGAYGVAAFLLGIAGTVPYQDLFHGRSLWERLPFWLQGAFLGLVILVPSAVTAQLVTGVLRTWRTSNHASVTATALSMILVMAVSTRPSSPLPSSPASTQSAAIHQNLRELLNTDKKLEFLNTLERRQGAVELAAFDVQVKAKELGADIGRIFTFVKEATRYEVYEGVLRGARGTMMSAAGNSYDKSLLLATLLNLNAFEVRFARGHLVEDRAKALVSQMFTGAAQELVLRTSPQTKAGIPIDSISRQVDQLAFDLLRTNLDLVSSELDREKVQLGQAPPISIQTLVNEAADHLWVEYKDGERWIALDPSFNESRPGESFADAETWSMIPAQFFHNVTIRLLVEERSRDESAEEEVLSHEATAADLNGAEVFLVHYLSLSGGTWSATPVLLIDGKEVRGRAFGPAPAREAGQLLTPQPIDSDKLPSEPKLEIVALWLEVNFTYPSGRTDTIRRSIFDRIGPVARFEQRGTLAPLSTLPDFGGIPTPLASIFAFSFSSGTLNPAFIHVRNASYLLGLRPSLESLLNISATRRQPSSEEEKQLSEQIQFLLPRLLSLVASSFHLYSKKSLRALLHGTRSWDRLWFYEASPRLAIAGIHPATTDGEISGDFTVSLDLRRNHLRVASEALPAPEVARANISRGILDGVLEHVLLSNLLGPMINLSPATSTIAVIHQAGQERTGFVLLTRVESARGLRIPSAYKYRILTSMHADSVVVAPARAVSMGGRERVGWWHISIDSGETLAFMDTGLHQAATEYPAKYESRPAWAVKDNWYWEFTYRRRATEAIYRMKALPDSWDANYAWVVYAILLAEAGAIFLQFIDALYH